MPAKNAKIHDEFTDLDVSRERKRQLRALKAGRCIVAGCTSALVTKNNCALHADLVNARQLAKRTSDAPPRSRYRTRRRIAETTQKDIDYTLRMIEHLESEEDALL